MQNIYDLHHKEKNITEASNLSSIYSTKLSQTARHNDRIVNFNILDSTVNKSLSGQTRKEQNDRLDNCQKDFGVEAELKLLNINKTTESIHSFTKNQTKILPESRKEIYHDTDINFFNCMSKHSVNTKDVETELKLTSDNIERNKEKDICDSDSIISIVDNEPLNLVIHSKKSTQHSHIYSEAQDRICSYPYSSIGDKGTLLDGAILRQIDHSPNVQTYNAEYKNLGLLKLFDLNELSYNSGRGKELLKISKLHTNSSETNGRTATNNDLKQERAHILDKYVTHVLPPRLSSDSKTLPWTHLQSNVKCNNIKKECYTKEEARKLENTDLVQLTACIPKLSNWACFEMSGQYPGHSRPPVGTPPPQTVWNHLTMAQGQSNLSFRLSSLYRKILRHILNMLINS